jgi:hypothetical protein
MPATVTPPPTPVAAQTPDVAAYVGGSRLTGARNITYESKFNDVGSASFSLPGTSAYSSERASITYGTIVKFKEFGTTTFIMRVESVQAATVAAGEEHDQQWTYTGRSVLAELDRAVVYPPEGMHAIVGGPLDGLLFGQRPFTDTRYWNWASPELDRTSWTSCTVSIQQKQSPPLLPPYGYWGGPEAWPDPNGYWIQPAAATSGYHTPRTWYAYKTFSTVGTSYGVVDIFASSGNNDALEVWVDGTPVIVAEGRENLKNHKVTLAVGEVTHTMVVKVTHGGGTTSGNTTGFLCAVFPHYDDGSGLVQSPIIRSDSSWKVVADDGGTPPGFTAAQIAAALVNEPVARGALSGWGNSFTPSNDVVGQPTPLVREFQASVGGKVTDTLKSLAELYGEFTYDLAATNGRSLQWWNLKGVTYGGGTYAGRGGASGVTLTPGTNVVSMTHTRLEPEVTTMVTRFFYNYAEFPNSTLISTYGRLEGFLADADMRDGVQVFYHSVLQTKALGAPSDAIENLSHRCTSGTIYYPGDTVTAPDIAGSSTTWRCMARAVSTDDDGNGIVTSQMGVARDDELARIDRWVKKRALMGTLDGRSSTASPSSGSIIESKTVSGSTLTFSTGGSGVTLVGDVGTSQRYKEPTVVLGIEIEANIAGASGTTTVRLDLNGTSALGTVSIASGASSNRVIFGTPTLVSWSDYLNIYTTAAGGAQGITVRVLGCPAL